MKKIGLIIGVLLVLLGAQAFYTVQETQQGLVLMLGKPVPGIQQPGLHYKMPLVQNVKLFDSRILEYDAQPAEVLTEDKKALVVDNYTKWRIVDPLTFYRTVNNIANAQSRLDEIVYSNVREGLGKFTLTQIVSKKRSEILSQVTAKSSEQAKDLGIEVLDVRIKRTDLPPENERAIFGRMRAERERQAKQYRSEGQEESAKIRSEADRLKQIMLAEAHRESEIVRGSGDANATRIYAQAYGSAPEFYSFKRSLDSYERSLRQNSRFIFTPETKYLRHMR